MIIPDNERDALRLLISQVRTDNKAALDLVCHRHGLEAGNVGWAEWSALAITMRWCDAMEAKFFKEPDDAKS